MPSPPLVARVSIVVALFVAIAAATTAALVLPGYWHNQDLQAERDVAQAFAQAWHAGRLASRDYAGITPDQVAARTQTITAALTPARTDLPSSVTVTKVTEATHSHPATAHLAVAWTLRGGFPWRYDTTAVMRKVNGLWVVAWTPAVVHPGLTAGQVLEVTRHQPPRAHILGAGGQVLVTDRPVVEVGLVPRRIVDPATTVRDVSQIVGVDTEGLARRVAAASPDAFVQVITFARMPTARSAPSIRPIPGTAFRQATMPLSPATGFARALLGTVGDATQEAVDASKGRVSTGDQIGLSGLQAAYDAQLAGTAGVTVSAATPGPPPPAPTPGRPVTLFDAVPPVPGRPLRLTLDAAIQEAAEAALGAATKPAALVAIQVGTGDVLAVANGGPDAAGYDRALLGRYPPGSTFKIATALALLRAGLTPDTPVRCPPTVTVDGKVFRNAEGEVLGTVPFQHGLRRLVQRRVRRQRAAGSPPSSSPTRRPALGYGDADTSACPRSWATCPSPAATTEHAAHMIGQGKVLVQPARRRDHVGVGGCRAARPRRASSSTRADTRRRRRATARPAGPVRRAPRDDARRGHRRHGHARCAACPAAPVRGKTGTAEFGTENPPQTHAWFTGYQGDVAFAVIVEGGGFGGGGGPARRGVPPAAARLNPAAARPPGHGAISRGRRWPGSRRARSRQARRHGLVGRGEARVGDVHLRQPAYASAGCTRRTSGSMWRRCASAASIASGLSAAQTRRQGRGEPRVDLLGLGLDPQPVVLAVRRGPGLRWR